MKLRYGRQLPRLGPSTLRLIVTSTPPMAVDAYWSVICKGSGRTAKAMRNNWYAPDSLISTGPAKTNGETNRVSNRTVDSRTCEAGLDVAALSCLFSAAVVLAIDRAGQAPQALIIERL
jgi:hypothetical protein